MTTPAEAPAPAPDLEADFDAALGACGGDLRPTICALLVANHYLNDEVDKITASLSRGYARGRLNTAEPG